MTQIIACHHCDTRINTIPVTSSERAICPTCQQSLYTGTHSHKTLIALIISACIISIPAFLWPFVSMRVTGQSHSMDVIDSIYTIAHDDMALLASVVAFFTIAAPLYALTTWLLISIPLARGNAPYLKGKALQYSLIISRWSMLDVYFLGAIIALVKLQGFADITFQPGFYFFAALVCLCTYISGQLNLHRVWHDIATLPQQTTPLHTS